MHKMPANPDQSDRRCSPAQYTGWRLGESFNRRKLMQCKNIILHGLGGRWAVSAYDKLILKLIILVLVMGIKFSVDIVF